MGGFPALPSRGNPYVGAAADYASSATHLATALREAANQQAQQKALAQQRQATQAHQGLMDQLDIMSKGGIPAEVVSDAPNAPGMKVRNPNPALPAGADPSRIISTDRGKYYIPTDLEREKAKQLPQDDTNSFSLSPTAATAMNEAGYDKVKAGDRVPMAHAGVVTEAVKAHLKSSALDDSNSVTLTQDMVDRLAPHGITLKPGARVSLEKAADLKDLVQMAEPKPGAEKSLHWERSENDAGDVTLRGLDPLSGAEVQKFSYPGEGKKRKDPDAEKPPSPAQFRQIETAKQQSMKQAATGLKKDLSEAISDDDKKTANENYRGALAAAQTAYEAEIGALTGKDVAHNSWADAANAAPSVGAQASKTANKPANTPPAAAAKPAANGQQNGKKAATMQHVRAYAARKYPNDPQGQAKALKEFQAYGYSIGGQ